MALVPLASAADLAERLNVPVWTGAELAQVTAMLEDASAELRALTGQSLNRATSTVTVWPDDHCSVRLPAFPVVSVDLVELNGVSISDTRTRGATLFFTRHKLMPLDEIGVTYTHGWDPIPDELVKWTCVLAAAYLSAAKETGALGMTAGVNSRDESIDDYRLAVSRGANPDAGLILPQPVFERLRASYGAAGMGWLTYR